MNNLAKKIASVSLSVTTAAWLSGASMLVPVASAQTVADLQAQIAALLAQITALQSQLGTMGGGATYNFTKDLTLGSKGDDVTALQSFLESKGHLVMPQGVAKGYFGNLTKAALAKYQAAAGISPAVGYFGPKTRANVNALAAAPTTPTTPTVPAGTGLSVSLASDQPASGLFGESFASRPFTKLVLTAGASDVTVKSLTVERTGQGQD
ncbi:MAG: peptidoglycan-binding protein, partial [Patescibacteria group bacterium]